MHSTSNTGWPRRSFADGFTIVELLVTVFIVAILSSVALPMMELSTRRAKEQDMRRELRVIREALDAYKQASDAGRIVRKAGVSGYPPDLASLVNGVPAATDITGAKLYFLRRVPRDPFSSDMSIPAERTWGKRSYASSSTEPKEGVDVYDVYSLSSEVGLNGIAYREW